MIKNLIKIMLIVSIAGMVFASAGKSSTEIRGQMRYIPFDNSSGTHTYGSNASSTTRTTNGFIGSVVDFVVLAINHKFNDNLSIQIDPTYQSNTKSTPVFGSDVAAQKSTSAYLFDAQNWDNAKLIYTVDGYTFSGGVMRNKLTWDYGDYLSWKDSLMETRFSVNSDIAWIDSGLELKKSVTVMEKKVGLTFQLLNGGTSQVDLNQQVAWLVKVEPELYGLKFEASYYNNMQANGVSSDLRAAVGVLYEDGPLYLRSEYVKSSQAGARARYNTAATSAGTDKQVGNDNKKQDGYNAIARYSMLPWIGQIEYAEFTNNNYVGVAYASDCKETYKDLALSVIYSFSKDFNINVTLMNSNYARSDSSAPTYAANTARYQTEVLDFTRLIIGTRVNF